MSGDIESNTRDLVIQTLTEMKSHVSQDEQRFEELRDRQMHTIDYLKEISKQISNVNETMAEARGAAKVGKLIIGGIGTAAGFIGGLAGHIAVK